MINRQFAGIAATVFALAVAAGRAGSAGTVGTAGTAGTVGIVGTAGSIDAQQPAVRVPTPVLERYVGEYGQDANSFKIVLKGNTLFQETPGQRRELQPISETLFHMGGVFTAEFVTDQAGAMTIVMSDGVEIEHRVPRKGSRAVPPPPLQATPVHVPRPVLQQYVGTYEFIPGQMSRTDLRVVVRLKGDTLVRSLADEQVLTPISQTQFRVGKTSLMVEFVVDEAGVTQVMGAGFQQLLSRRTSKR